MVQQALRALRLKGVATVETLVKALRVPDCDVREQLQALVAANHVKELARGYTLTPDGREALATQITAERSSLDRQKTELLYVSLCDLNVKFKKLMKDWQIRTIDVKELPNDHGDLDYDAAIVARLGLIDGQLQELLAAIVALAPRLAPYRPRFADALAAIRAGDRTMMAAPIKDSYHTLWFELHEEFIDLCGRTRAGEAAAGRGD